MPHDDLTLGRFESPVIVETARAGSVPVTEYLTYSLPEQIAGLEKAIRQSFFNGDYTGALKTLAGLVECEGLEPYYTLIKAKCLLELRQFEAAHGLLSALARRDPWCADTHYLLGELRLFGKHYKKAVSSFSSSCQLKAPVTLFNTAILSFLGRAIALTFLGREGSASIDTSHVERLRPLKHAMTRYWCGDIDGAVEAFENLPLGVCRLPQARFFKGLLLQAQGLHAEALSTFPAVPAASYNGSPTLFFRALSHFHMANWARCASECSRILSMPALVVSIETWPATQSLRIVDITDVLKLRAECYIAMQNFGDALADYDRLAKLCPTPQVYMKRSSLLYRFGFARAAYDDAERAEQVTGCTLESLKLRMRCLLKMGKTGSASDIAHKILVESPNDEQARMTLAVLAQSVHSPASAKESLSLPFESVGSGV